MVLDFMEFDLFLLAHNYSRFSRRDFKSCLDWSLAALFDADVPAGFEPVHFSWCPLLHNWCYLPGDMSVLFKLPDNICCQTETHSAFPPQQLKFSKNAWPSRLR